MPDPHVAFVGSAGQRSADPTRVLPSPPTVDPAGAALLFAPPAMSGEFLPASLWQGLTLDRPTPPPLLPDQHPAGDHRPLPEVFHRAVADLCTDAEHIGVLASGGLDSLAVLVHAVALARRDGRRVTAFTHDLRDDQGRSAATVTRHILTVLDLDCDHLVLDPAEGAVPRWSPVGPRLDALPAANAALAARAAQLGVTVLLSGDGADEALATPRFTTAAVARTHGTRGAIRYLRDVTAAHPGWWSEALAILAPVLPARAAARLYWATNWPEWCTFTAPALVAAAHRDGVARWSRDWVNDQIHRHIGTIRAGWARADAYDALWPHDPIPQAGEVPEASPFLDPEVLTAAARAPLAHRYDPTAAGPYHRCKAAVVALFPPAMRPHLPHAKQYFTSALATSQLRPAADRAIAAGILDADAVARETDTAALMVVAALEQWLHGAQQRGAGIPGVCSPSPLLARAAPTRCGLAPTRPNGVTT